MYFLKETWNFDSAYASSPSYRHWALRFQNRASIQNHNQANIYCTVVILLACL
jgi:hypothetical protein